MYLLEVWRMFRDMKDKGMSNREIATDLSISRNTVSKLLTAKDNQTFDSQEKEERFKA